MPGAVSFASPDTISLPAGANLSTHQFKFVKLDASGNVVLAAAVLDNILGILQNKPTSGQAALVKIGGGSKLKVDATTDIAANDKITTDANGKGIKTTANLNIIRAWALEAATLAAAGADSVGEVISVLLVGPYMTAAS